MAPTYLFDLAQIDLTKLAFTIDDIEAINPQRGHMRMLDGIIWTDDKFSMALGYKDTREDEFWVPGHIPGRPLLPGVLMVEAAAQISSFMINKRDPSVGFIGFTGLDNVKFRKQVPPNERLYLLGREVKFNKRRVICDIQGMHAGDLVFEARVTGMSI